MRNFINVELFSVNTLSKNYTSNTTEIRATAVNFSGKGVGKYQAKEN